METYYRAWQDLERAGLKPNERTYVYSLLMRLQRVPVSERRSILSRVGRAPEHEREESFATLAGAVVKLPSVNGTETSSAVTYGIEHVTVSADDVAVRLQLTADGTGAALLTLASDEGVRLARMLLEAVEQSQAAFEAKFSPNDD